MRLTRRQFLGGASAVALTAAQGTAWAATEDDPCRHVDPFIGTGGHGHTFPGATLPWGMVQLGPDTENERWDSCGGYHYDDRTIMGFSHTHLSGTGIGDLLDVLVVPATGPLRLVPGALDHPDGGYRTRYDHRDERAEPGYYRVMLPDHAIEAELTATARAGFHRYRFGKEQSGHLLIDLHHGMQDKRGVPTRVSDAVLRLIGDDTLVGTRRVHQWADGRIIHFALKLSRPFAEAILFSDDQPLAAGTAEMSGTNLKCALIYPDAHGLPLLVKVGISAVDVEGALRNLDAEIPGWDFDEVRMAARAAWRTELSRVGIAGASARDKRIFYTALYHAFLSPTLFSDIDGRYRGMDRQVRQLPEGQRNYSTYSLWDGYRALHPMLTLIQPDRVPDFVQTLVRMGEESPAGVPVWPLQGIETGCMIGHHSAVVIAEAQAKGFQGIDYPSAWRQFRKRAFEDTAHGLDLYRERAYIPCDLVDEAVSRTLEYAYDDWAIAALAEGAGDPAAAAGLRERSRNYRNVFDRQTDFVRPRQSDGSWISPFDPRALGHMKKWRDFTETNAWQATFLNQHDLYGYMTLFGGEAAFEAKLDTLFTTSSEMPPDAPPDIAGLVGQYAHGNEPSHHVAYLYAYTGAHYKTQARIRMLLKTMHRDKPDGLAGNEDCGQMSAWYVMSALGLYAVDPVTARYVFGSPLFPRAVLQVGEGRELVIETENNAPDNAYIQSVSWNGRPYRRSWIGHDDISRGGRLVFRMGPHPNRAFGEAPADRPPSFR